MSLPDFSTRRPITIAMICLALAMLGLISLTRLPIDLYPNFSHGDISIIINIRGGMPPVEVEHRVTRLVEDAVGDASHLKDIISISEEGRSRVVLTFAPGTDMDFAALEVREKFSKIRSELPKEIEKPVIAKFEQEDRPVLITAVTALGFTPEMLRRLVDEQIKDRLMRVEGVANVDIGGGRERKILVEIDIQKLQAFRLPIDRVTRLLNVSNLNMLTGEVDKSRSKYMIRAMGEFQSLEEVENLGIAVTPTRSVIRLKDVATVKDSFLEATSYARVNTLPVVSLYIQKETTANTVEVVRKTEKALQELEKDPRLPEELTFITTYDQSIQIKRAIQMVGSALLSGGVLAILVLGLFFTTHWFPRLLFLPAAIAATVVAIATYRYSMFPVQTVSLWMGGFLTVLLMLAALWKHVRVTLIAAIALPIATVVTFAFMFFANQSVRNLDMTLNVMTLGGLALGIGMLVDNSVVVIDNIIKRRAAGDAARQAAGKGATEVFLAIVASTFTTIVVLIPIVFLNKEVRILYTGFSLIICFSLLASLFVAVSVVPLLASRLKFPVVGGNKKRVWYRSLWRKIVMLSLRWRWIVAMMVVFIGIGAVQIYQTIPREFIGATEAEDFTIFVELPSGAKLEISDEAVAKIETVLNDVPEVKSISSRIERWSSKIYVKLVPLAERSRSTKDVIDSLRDPIQEVEKSFQEAFVYFEEPNQVETNEIILEIYGYDYDILNQLAVEMLKAMQGVPGLTDLKVRWRRGRPEWLVRVDKQKASKYGLAVEDVANSLHAKMRGLRATLYHTEGKEVEIVTRLEEPDRATLDKLKRITFTLPNREVVFLEQIAKLDPGIGPSKIWRKNKQRMIQVSANRGRYAFGEAAQLVFDAVKKVPFPEDYYWRFGANYWKLLKNQKELRFAFGLSLILVFLVLASLFESLVQPFIIMLTLSLAGLGAVIALKTQGQALNVGALMGFILLGGINVNAAIILVDEVNRLRAAGFRAKRAVVLGAISRVRPILITSLTTILGLLPLALSRTEDSSLWAPMALVVVGGLTLAMFTTPLVVPCLYMILEDSKAFLYWLGTPFRKLAAVFKKTAPTT